MPDRIAPLSLSRPLIAAALLGGESKGQQGAALNLASLGQFSIASAEKKEQPRLLNVSDRITELSGPKALIAGALPEAENKRLARRSLNKSFLPSS